MPRTKFTHQTKTGATETRTSTTKRYVAVIVGTATAESAVVANGAAKPGDQVVLSWSESASAAAKRTTAKEYAAYTEVHVETINDGTTTEPVPTPTAPAGFIDASLMERAIALRGEGKTMKAIGAELGVKTTGYLAKKIKETYGADALAVAKGGA